MKKIKDFLFKNETGLTLVEVLASIMILAIVLLLFLLIFLQSMNTSHTSEKVITATYVAQTEMELLYSMSKNNIREGELLDEGYTKIHSKKGWQRFKKEFKTEDDDNYIIIKLKELDESPNSPLTQVIVEVLDSANNNQRTQMENLFEWKVLDND